MKFLPALIAALALSGCAEVDRITQSLNDRQAAAEKKQQGAFEAKHADPHGDAAREISAAIPICGQDAETAESYYSCIGKIHDQAYARNGVDLETGVPLELQLGIVGEDLDAKKLSEKRAQVRIIEILNHELEGPLIRRAAAERQKVEEERRQWQALGQAMGQVGRDMQAQQRHNSLINTLNRPKSMNCNHYGNRTNCTTW